MSPTHPSNPLEADNRGGNAAPVNGAGVVTPRRRVILVGRTGLDGSLAGDPSTGVVGTVDALGAIGALSRGTGTGGGGGGGGSTVVVGPDADPGADAGRFIEGLRQVDPAVRVVVVGDQTRGVYDEALAVGSKDLSGPGLGGGPSAGTALPKSPVVVEVPAGTAPPPPSAFTDLEPAPIEPVVVGSQGVSVSLAGDLNTAETPLVEALLHGRDLLLPALELVRTRVGSKDIVFVPAPPHPAAGEAAQADGSWSASVVVSHAGIEHGRLVSATLPAARLDESSRWLGAWLALKNQHDQLRHAAFTDELTGAYNRRYFSRFLLGALEQARVRRVPLTVLVFDIDNFKTYNDRYGHAAGDEILSEVSRLMRSTIRPADKVCRIGGDEFAVIFYDPAGPRSGRNDADAPPAAPEATPGPGQAGGSPASIFSIATRFQRQICEHRFPKLGTEAPGTLTISGGMATFPWDGNSAEELLQRADELAMKSKQAGKNVITLGPGSERVCRM